MKLESAAAMVSKTGHGVNLMGQIFWAGLHMMVSYTAIFRPQNRKITGQSTFM